MGHRRTFQAGKRLWCTALSAAIAVACGGIPAVASAQATDSASALKTFDIPAGPLGGALSAYGAQSGKQLVYQPDLVKGKTSKAVTGQHDDATALRQLLAGTGLSWNALNDTTIVIKQADAEPRPATRPRQERSKPAKGEDDDIVGMPAIMVTGTRTLNMDIMRTEDDTQPYVVFDRERIENSLAENLDEFFKNNLPMATGGRFTSQGADPEGNRSKINLRGLGSDETLILVDGRRVAALGNAGTAGQPDVNGIPLSAIERIEVLPATASGIHGGGATGGVINIVLRRDYSGLETSLTYGSVFEGSAADRRVDVSAGWNLENGRTNIMVAGTYSESDALLTQERNFVLRGRQHILLMNPSYFYSAGYPPLGATTNIRSDSGENLTLKDGTPLNSPITYVPPGYPGAQEDNGAALVANAGKYNLHLADTAQGDGGGRQALTNSPKVESVLIMARREFSSTVQGFLEVAASKNSGEFVRSQASTVGISVSENATNNPFQQAIRVTVPVVGSDGKLISISETRRVVAGSIIKLPKDWRAEVDFTWGRSRFSYSVPNNLTADARAGIEDGTLDVLRDMNLFPVNIEILGEPSLALSPTDVTLRSTAVRLAGVLPWALPGGNPVLSGLIEHRSEKFDDAIQRSFGRELLIPSRSQSVDSTYLEVKFPLISARNNLSVAQELEMQVAVRGDRYEVNGASTSVDALSPAPVARSTNSSSSIDPTVGLRYVPFSGVMLRTSYGTGYLPPSVSQLVPGSPLTLPVPLGQLGLTDPLRGNEPLGIVPLITGGNPNLRPEQSESYSFGVVLTPRTVPGLRVSVDWSQIEKRDNITFLQVLSQSGLDDLMAAAPDRFTRSAPSGGFPVGPITAVDGTLLNIARLQVEAIDLSMEYQFDVGRFGTVSWSADATRLLSLRTQVTETSPVVENAGVSVNGLEGGGGLDWKATSALRWSRGNWMLGWTTRFFDSYFLNTDHSVNENQGAATIPSQIYHDFVGSYHFDSSTQVQFGIRNVFGKRPPIDVVTNFNGSHYSPWGDPRVTSYSISIRKSF